MGALYFLLEGVNLTRKCQTIEVFSIVSVDVAGSNSAKNAWKANYSAVDLISAMITLILTFYRQRF